MRSSTSLLKAARLMHLYLGVFAAPALLFFAFTGAIQTFSLHETTKGSNYAPPRVLVILGQIHKKQTRVIAVRKGPPPSEAASPKPEKHADPPASHAEPAAASAMQSQPAAASAEQAKQHNPLPLKIFFLLVAISLFVSTFTGIYMSYKYTRNKVAITGLLFLGMAIPTLMAVL